MGNFEVKISAARKYLGEAEITIQTVKGGRRGIINTLPYSYLQSQIIIQLVYFIVMCLNALPDGKWIYQKYSSR